VCDCPGDVSLNSEQSPSHFPVLYRGGSGKSVILSSVVRSDKIRERFTGGIAWIGLSQAPNLLALQQRCYLQLMKQHIPKTRQSSVEEQHSCLSAALVGKTVLLVCDDVCE
jgi:hypothetical protein